MQRAGGAGEPGRPLGEWEAVGLGVSSRPPTAGLALGPSENARSSLPTLFLVGAF